MIDIITILQGFGISLGVGASTLAVVNFFVAVWDGKIDEGERRMMGVVYIVLRIAMALILLTTSALGVQPLLQTGNIDVFTIQIISLLTILFMNAGLMTLHLIPATFGPAIQSSAWYLMGFVSLFRLADFEIPLFYFPFAFLTLLVFTTGLINFFLLLSKSTKH